MGGDDWDSGLSPAGDHVDVVRGGMLVEVDRRHDERAKRGWRELHPPLAARREAAGVVHMAFADVASKTMPMSANPSSAMRPSMPWCVVATPIAPRGPGRPTRVDADHRRHVQRPWPAGSRWQYAGSWTVPDLVGGGCALGRYLAPARHASARASQGNHITPSGGW